MFIEPGGGLGAYNARIGLVTFSKTGKTIKSNGQEFQSLKGDGYKTNFFDIETGADYPDGDEWFIVDFLFPFDMKIPDGLKGPDYFTTIPTTDNKSFWHHRDMIRYKYGKTKKLTEALEFLDTKYKELHSMIEPLEKDIK